MKSLNAGCLLTISVVSHNQGSLIQELLEDLNSLKKGNFEVIATINIEEEHPFSIDELNFPIKIKKNVKPLGFGENHNLAFDEANGRYFCVLNPDIRIQSDPFSLLIEYLENNRSVGVVSPLIVNEAYSIEDSARRFPTPMRILKRKFTNGKILDYKIGNDFVYPDWLAGMFMLFKSDTYRSLGGYDENYFMYCEDADICARAWYKGYTVVLMPQVKVIHKARRDSQKKVKHFVWHVRSLFRYFLSHPFNEKRSDPSDIS